MILKCGCGWQGINLIPNYEDDTARCPWCNAVFKDIPAESAIGAAQFAESQLKTMEFFEKMPEDFIILEKVPETEE